MAVKTFTQAEKLTAADTNTYLNNGGLVYVTSTTIGTAVSSVTVSNCFSSTYDNYRLTLTGTIGNSAGNFNLQLSGITGSNYFIGGTFFNYASTTVNGYGPAATTVWSAIAPIGTNYSAFVIDLFGPNLADEKAMFSQGTTTAAYYSFGGSCTSTSAATGFVLSHNVTSMTGGTLTVFGYRKA